jgi:asparagine synthase (glutamine-hydrolysing)
MCGIFGTISKEKVEVNKNILHHRGPDDWGVEYLQNNFSLTFFQSRLSIIGLGSQGHQPFRKFKDYILCYNGEIYNYKFLKKKLIKTKNIEFETETDTELLYEYLIAYGIKRTLNDIDGIFSFSFYNNRTEELLLARDHLGVKPLYYFFDSDKFFYSSEPKVFFELKLLEPRLDKTYLGEYLANGWLYEPDTLFEGVKKVQAGHYLNINIKKNLIKENKYWDISTKPKSKIPDIDKIIKEQTVSDVPMGIYFSGGIDSSIITHTLLDYNLINLNLNLKDSESLRVNDFEKLYNIKVEKTFYKNNSLKTYDELLYFLDEPIADPAIIPAYLLAKSARELGCTVMLSGMGGDEIDAGYTRHRILLKPFIYKLLSYLPNIPILKGKRIRDLLRLKNFFKEKEPHNYYSLTSYFSELEINSLIDKSWKKTYKEKINSIVRDIDGLMKYFYLDIKGFLTSHNLLYMDKASMAASIEVRVPLIQKDIASHFFQNIIEKNQKNQKSRLKNILISKMGNNYNETKKEGFRYPIEKWIREDINWINIITFFEKRNIMNTAPIKSWVKISKDDTEIVAMKLWSLYTLYIWLNSFPFLWEDN